MIAKVTTIFPLFFTSCLSQYAMDFGTHADMSFGQDNDRFDIEAIMQDQSSMDMVNQFASRRFINQGTQNKQKEDVDENKASDNKINDKYLGTELLDALKQTVDQLAENNGFVYHDDMKPLPNDNEEDYEKNLQKFSRGEKTGKMQTLQDKVDSLHGGEKSGRRGMPPNPEHEILFHYGVPVNMKLNGYLQVPLRRM